MTKLSSIFELEKIVLFLLPGHTKMPADSVHATIECFIYKCHVWAPSEWATVIRAARINPFPYEVVTLEQEDIHNWSADCEFASGSKNAKGVKVQWKDIRMFAANSGKVCYTRRRCLRVSTLQISRLTKA